MPPSVSESYRIRLFVRYPASSQVGDGRFRKRKTIVRPRKSRASAPERKNVVRCVTRPMITCQRFVTRPRCRLTLWDHGAGEIALRRSGISNLHPIRTAAWISARRCAVVFEFVTRMVKELDLFESNHGCGLN